MFEIFPSSFAAVPYIERKIAEGEHQHQDFKFAINDSLKIAESLCAFANAEGGTLLIGVKDNGSIAGIKPEEELHMLEAAAEIYSKPVIEFEAHVWKTGNRYVLEAIVAPSALKPHFVVHRDGRLKSYIRVGDQNLATPAVLLEVWRSAGSIRPQKYSHTEKEKRVFSALENSEGQSFSALARHTKIPRKILTPLLARLIRWQLVSLFFDKDRALFRLQ